MSRTISLKLLAVTFLCCLATNAQTPKNFTKNGLSFDYPGEWALTDDTTDDAQQLTLNRSDADAQIRIFVHKGRVTQEKLPDAKKGFIDPYIASTAKQFVAMGAKPEQSPDTSEIGGVKADGVKISASLGGEPGAARIYWAVVGQRVVVMTYFGPDKQMKQYAPAWDMIRTSLKVVDPKATPSPSPTP